MNNWLITDKRKINIEEIPVLPISELRLAIILAKKRPIAFFGQKINDKTKLYVILADDENAQVEHGEGALRFAGKIDMPRGVDNGEFRIPVGKNGLL